MENDSLPQYMQIALSIAGRIAGGDVPEGAKISGRSKLSSEYNVSPETIRKAVRLLSDMRVVDVREKSGVYVLSADNARRYLHNAGAKIDVFAKRQQMKELLEQQERVSRQLAELCRSILDYASFPVQADDTLPNYVCRIPKNWSGIGKNLRIFISGRRPARRSSPSGAAPPVSCPPAPTRSCTAATRSFLSARTTRGKQFPASSAAQNKSRRERRSGKEYAE